MEKQASLSAMNSSQRNVSDDSQTIRRRSEDELLLKLPIDLVMEIFSRLPLKSIARCRCVSKQWSSVLRRPDFTELFLSKTLARPKLLFAHPKGESEVIFFSSPSQPQNPLQSLPLIATVDHHISVPFESFQKVSCCVNGYVCISDYRTMSKGRETEEEEEEEEEDVVYVICNPSTGQCLDLPEMYTTRKVTGTRSFLGYDPIEKQHKVLATIKQDDGAVVHKVLTVRGNNGNMTWRLIECSIPHYDPGSDYICINGVLYYIAKASSGEYMIVYFDVRSEKCSSFKAMEKDVHYATLINFQGKLASLTAQPDLYYLSRASTSLEMWILQDLEKHEWSKRIFSLPPMWKDVVAAGEHLYFTGATDTNEFVITPVLPCNPFHVYYYNFVKESIRRVEIQGMGALEMDSVVLTYLNHVEDVRLM